MFPVGFEQTFLILIGLCVLCAIRSAAKRRKREAERRRIEKSVAELRARGVEVAVPEEYQRRE